MVTQNMPLLITPVSVPWLLRQGHASWSWKKVGGKRERERERERERLRCYLRSDIHRQSERNASEESTFDKRGQWFVWEWGKSRIWRLLYDCHWYRPCSRLLETLIIRVDCLNFWNRKSSCKCITEVWFRVSTNISFLLSWHPRIHFGHGQQMRLSPSRGPLFCLKIPLQLKRIFPPQRLLPKVEMNIRYITLQTPHAYT